MKVHAPERYTPAVPSGTRTSVRLMDKADLAARLASGASIEAIARAVRRDPSTVAYWVNKHGLASVHAAKHAARGGIPREQLAELVERQYTVQDIAEELGWGATTVRYWLKKHGLTTARTVRTPSERPPVILRRCRTHGFTQYVLTAGGKRYRCRRCRIDAVSARRRRVKRALIEAAGGACGLCGYDRYPGALQFHHLNPTEKTFAIADRGVARSLESALEEARKCVLVCANCHAELEGGIATMPKLAPRAG
jgi:transposase-like protein